MALIKEPYGLVYNTDGTLCTTYRDDDVPFRGVRSFAVETATTNLLGNTVFDTAIFTEIFMGPGTILNHLPGKGLYGSMLTRATKSDNMTQSYISAARKIQTLFIPQVGKTYTYSVYARLYGKQSNQPFYLAYYDGKFFRIDVGLLTPEWKRYSYTFTVIPEYTGGEFLIYNLLPHSSVEVGSGFEICLPQVEQKPFATSFVDGNRPAGRLRVGIDDLRDGRLYNHVLTFWFKVPPISTYELGNWPGRVGIVGNRVNPTYNGYSDYGIFIESNGNLNFGAMLNPEGSITLSFPQIPKEEYENRWNNVVIVFDEDDNLVRHYKIYFNGEYHGYADVTRMDNYHNQAKPDTFYFYGSNLRSHLLSNIYIGKYRRPDGTVIWTDDYIREVYEAKIPFPVQSQLSIY